MSDNNQSNYYSMMGLLNKDSLAAVYEKGDWHDFKDLDSVLNIMEKNENGEEDKHSIPDVYGRAIQYKITFESARRKNAEMGTGFIPREILEWRGIITAIALKDFLDLKMKIDIVQYGDTGQAFDEALKYPPRPELFTGKDYWKKGEFHILTLQGDNGASAANIAMFSQLTVFCPVADLRRKMPEIKKLTWFDYKERKFLNPAQVLSDTESRIVYFWADNLKKKLEDQGEAANTVLYHLNEYINELKENFDWPDYEKKKCFALTEYDNAYGQRMINCILNEVINQTVILRADFGSGLAVEYKDLFAEQICYTKADKSPFEKSGSEYNYKIQNTGNIGNGRDIWYAFLPLGKKAVEICDIQTVHLLAQNMKMQAEYDLDGGLKYIKATLRLSDISDQFVDAEKIYHPNDAQEIVEENEEDFPVIALWPPCYMRSCETYYIYLESSKPEGKIELALSNAEEGENRFVKVVKEYPKAISLQKANKCKESRNVGVVVPEYNPASTKNAVPINAVVGIDFGTSGTTVYAKISDRPASLIKIWEDHSVLLTQASDSDRTYLSQRFITADSSGQEQNKLHSVYRRASDQLLDTVNPILDGIIYQAGEMEIVRQSELYMPDIKWNSTTNKAYFEAFIKELCMHIWMELRKSYVTTIEWRYALPSSLWNRDIYVNIWDTKIQDFLNQNIKGVTHNVGLNHYTESEATSMYFQKSSQIKMVNVDKGYIVVDIGGGSTDIAVWQRQGKDREAALVAQTSVPVAGRRLFTRLIALNLKSIRDYVLNNDAELEDLQKLKEGGNYEIVNAILEQIIHAKSDTIQNAYWQDDQWSAELKYQIEFGVAMLFFALGNMVGHLQEIGALKVLEREGSFSIAVCGNGSKILDWVYSGENYAKLLAVFEEGIKSRKIPFEPYEPRIIKSGAPKQEVALGLLENKGDTWKDKKADITEVFSDEQAIALNNVFLEKYNTIFDRNVRGNNENDIHALMAGVNREMDVCNFFMTNLYAKYYGDRITGKEDRTERV